MFKVRMKVGGSIYPFTLKISAHSEAEVIEVNEKDEVVRIVDPLEWKRPDFDKPAVTPAPVAAKPAPAPKKKAPKKKANKQSAIPDDSSLENIDVSSI